MKITPKQALTLHNLMTLHGEGELRADGGILWLRTAAQDWCINHDGFLIGWNDV